MFLIRLLLLCSIAITAIAPVRADAAAPAAFNWIERGNRDAERGDLLEALRDYTQAMAQLPNSPEPSYDRALTYLRLHRLPEALVDARSAIAIDPRFADGYALLARVLSDQGADASAEEAATRAISLDWERIDFRLRRADILLKRNDGAGAAVDYGVVLGREPDNLVALRGLAGIRLAQHQELAAAALLRRFVAKNKRGPEDPDVTVALSSLALERKAYADALQLLDAQPIERPDARRNRARALDGLGRHAEAYAVLLPNGDAESRSLLARWYFADNRCDEAQRAYAEVSVLSPSDGTVWNDLAAASLCAGDFRAAVRASARAVEVDPADATAFRYRANALRGIGDTRGSIRASHRALDLGGDEPKLLMMVGVDEYRAGMLRTGWSDYKRGCEMLAVRASPEAGACREQSTRMQPPG